MMPCHGMWTVACLRAAVIASQRLTYAVYLDRLRSFPLVDYLRPAEGESYPSGLAEATLMSIDAVTAADPAGLCGPLLDVIALLSPAGVSRELLFLAGRHGTLRQEAGPAQVDEALARLTGATLLSFGVDGATVSAHTLVARVIRERQARDGTLLAAATAVEVLLDQARAELGEAWQTRVAVREWVTHVAALTGRLGPDPESRDVDLLKSLFGLRAWALRYLLDLGDSPVQAINLGEPLLADLEQVQGASDPVTLSVGSNLGYAYMTAGRTRDAIPLFEGTLAERQRLLGESHPDSLRSRASLAIAYASAGRVAEVVPLLDAEFVEDERVLGPVHPDTLRSRVSLGTAYASIGRAADAILLYERALTGLGRVLGAEHPDTIRAREALSAARHGSGEIA